MFINTVNNDVSFFSVNYFNESGLSSGMLRSKCGLYERRLEMYKRVLPAEDSVEVDSKE